METPPSNLNNRTPSSSDSSDTEVEQLRATQTQVVSGPRKPTRSSPRRRGLPTTASNSKHTGSTKRKASSSNKKKDNSKKKKKKNEEEDELEVSTGNNKRTKNFSPEEDILISRAFIAATENECEGANKKGDAFYERVLEKFLAIYKQETPEDKQDEVVLNRNAAAIQNRWSRHINKDVQLFNGHYKRVKESKPSGYSSEDIITLALEEYRVQEGSKFRFIDCIPVLHAVPKFNPLIKQPETKVAKKQSAVNQINNTMGLETPRPLGTKAAKKLYKQKIGLEDATTATMSAVAEKKVAAVEKVGKAGEQLALVLKRKSERQHLLDMAKFYQSMGDTDTALEHMNKLHKYDKEIEEEDIQKKKKENEEATKKKNGMPPSANNNEKPPSVIEVVETNKGEGEDEGQEEKNDTPGQRVGDTTLDDTDLDRTASSLLGPLHKETGEDETPKEIYEA
jgi:hypothetical protein